MRSIICCVSFRIRFDLVLFCFLNSLVLILNIFNHVALIKSNKKSIRGNHFHKKTIQYTYVLDGKLYYFKKKGRSYQKKILKKGDLIKTMPLEIHAFKFLAKKNTLLIFSSGLRGGKDYEKDTFRVESIVK